MMLLLLSALVEIESSGERQCFCDASNGDLASTAHCYRQGLRRTRRTSIERFKSSLGASKIPGRSVKSLRLPVKHVDHFLATQFPEMAPPTHLDRIKAALRRDDGRVLHIQQVIDRRAGFRLREKRRGLKQIRRFHYDPTPPPPPPHYTSFSADLVSGLSVGSGEYFLELTIGTPGHRTALIVDTGSDLTWLQCEPCDVCFSQLGPPFSPANSSTFESVNCKAPECTYVDRPEKSQCSPQHPTCTYVYSYGDRSNTTGMFSPLSCRKFGNVYDELTLCFRSDFEKYLLFLS